MYERNKIIDIKDESSIDDEEEEVSDDMDNRNNAELKLENIVSRNIMVGCIWQIKELFCSLIGFT